MTGLVVYLPLTPVSWVPAQVKTMILTADFLKQAGHLTKKTVISQSPFPGFNRLHLDLCWV